MQFSPEARIFSPSSADSQQQGVSQEKQVSPPSTCLEARVTNLEEAHADWRGGLYSMEKLYQALCLTMNNLRQSDRVEPYEYTRKVNASKSHQEALQLKAELDDLTKVVEDCIQDDSEDVKAKDIGSVNVTRITPPGLEASWESRPPSPRRAENDCPNPNHDVELELSANLRGHESLTKDDQVDGEVISTPTLSPPASPPATAVQVGTQTVENPTPDSVWVPYYIRSLKELPGHIRSTIPTSDMVTFSPDFINTTLKGESWTPGLRFINGAGPPILKNRTYYILDPETEPFLPAAPGEHGAKLTAFFKECPENFHDNFVEGASSYEDVPMFIEVTNAKGHARYIYYGNYSQTRWSDKLDHDTMMTKIPVEIKKYWASELVSAAREEWVTEELKKHFFPKPEYEGSLCVSPGQDGMSVPSDVKFEYDETMAGDIRQHIKALREWDRDAKLKTALINEDFVLRAFNEPDYGELPALRLSWEYLECVSWRRDFYDLLVTLQSREKNRME